ncbi:hypothetical protein J5N97_007695 [Dioscorea zingiberensis]|uniref:Non-specific lipid-transfer protein n=1 Tax=Dioscorea zingiberensis TaxID=325984 RepID=A0A9D5DD19_9LILI|nr:hypothetical protein J5N97_007695 [Dioscorea zingiberensis]
MARHLLPSLMAVLLVAFSSLKADAAPPCAQITRMITPCAAYLADRALTPYGPCCMGVTALDRSAPLQDDRVAVCSCLKIISPRFPIMDSTRASSLPTLCGVSINITVTPSIDCNMMI